MLPQLLYDDGCGCCGRGHESGGLVVAVVMVVAVVVVTVPLHDVYVSETGYGDC